MQVGVISSALEHATPEQMFAPQDPNADQPNAISAVKALQIASAQGQRIYQITQANMATALPNIHHDQETMDEIRASLNAGKEVITHTDSVSVPGWIGAGYIILDKDTGDGAYKISGGVNGGFLLGLAVGVLLVLAMIVAFPVGGSLIPLMFAGLLAIVASETLNGASTEACFHSGIILGVTLALMLAAFVFPIFLSVLLPLIVIFVDDFIRVDTPNALTCLRN